MQERNLDELEDELLTTLRVGSVLYGVRSADHAGWARTVMSEEEAQHYIEAWKEGRRRHWKDMQRLGQRIRKVSNEDGLAWQSRLAQLELLSGTRVADMKPTTQSGSL
jgi:hypothetical protein